MSKEIWRITSVPNLEVSSFGNVRNALTKREYAKSKNTKGYLQVHVTHKGTKHVKYIHRLVVECFITSVFDQVDHIDGDKENNSIENLRPCTQRQNVNYSKKSKHIGAHYDSWTGKWLACVCINKKRKNLGRFNTPEEASETYLKYLNSINERAL